MNIQIYAAKKNPDVLKAERFFKERRIPYQMMDLKKHKLGERELQTMAQGGGGLMALIDREDKKVKEHPASYCNIDSALKAYILENPWLLKAPIVRSGSKVTVGYQPSVWEEWISQE